MNFFMYNENTCTRVKLFGEDVKNLFLLNDYKESSTPQTANYVIINTCSFLKTKSDYFLDRINYINKMMNVWQKLLVVGCLGATHKKDILNINPNILIFTRDLNEIKEFFQFTKMPVAVATNVSYKLSFKQNLLYMFNKYILHSKHIEFRLKRDNVCYIQMSVGCKGHCSYCSEKFITTLKSRPIDEIISAVRDGINRGFTLFSLSSDDASAYGKDIGTSLQELLDELVKFEEDIYFIIPEFNPHGLTKHIIELLNDKKFLYITIPIQSGSQKILNKMRRPYQIKEVINKVKEIKAQNKNLMINTHIIVGFPGETDEDFLETKKILSTGLFDRVKVFMYSDRPDTEASLFKNKVPHEIKEKRMKEILKTIRKSNFKKLSLTNLILNLEQIKE